MKSFVLIFLLASIMFHSSTLFAGSFYESARKKQDRKDAQRWSLSQWLEQKQKIKLMDSWLMYNAPSPYEFFLSADTSSLKQTNVVGSSESFNTYRNYRGALAAFVTLVGLYGEYETSDEELEQWKGLFLLRLLGSSDQSTNLTIGYGLMSRNLNEDVTQYQVASGRLTFYLIKAFALTGGYEHYFEANSEQDVVSEGNRIEAGAHIEYGALRIYGTWFQEKMNLTDALLNESTRKRDGILFGTRLYF